MKLKHFALLLVAIAMIQACNDEQSRVVSFMYGGYDTSFALLTGEVYEVNPVKGVADSLLALAGVTITAKDTATGKIYSTVNTDAGGKFAINFLRNGTFNLAAEKVGYQAAKITNYIADTGQVSTVKIILAKDHTLF